MNRIRSTFRCLTTFAMTAAVWADSSTAAWAQGGRVSDKSYVVPYFVVVMIIAIFMAMILRPTNRETEVKQQRKED